jgi:hypothetical protein
MKLLFVHDHIFCESKNGDIYSPGGFPKTLWSKYTSICDELMVVGRCTGAATEVSDKHVLSASKNDPIQFEFVKSISTPFKHKLYWVIF